MQVSLLIPGLQVDTGRWQLPADEGIRSSSHSENHRQYLKGLEAWLHASTAPTSPKSSLDLRTLMLRGKTQTLTSVSPLCKTDNNHGYLTSIKY